MTVKQINLYKDKSGKVTGMTLFFHDETPPAIMTYNPPVTMELKIMELKKKTTVAHNRKKQRASHRN